MSIVYFNRYTRQEEEEQVMGKGAIKWLYGTGLGKVALHVLVKRALFSHLMGMMQNSTWSKKNIQPFIDQFGINMDESVLKPGDFRNFNDFFYRKLHPEARPVNMDESIAVFPADARHMGWQDASNMMGVFIKGQEFDIPALLGSKELGEQYAHGTVILSRLCPTDYHRFHFPVAGVPGTSTLIPGSLASVSPYCLRGKLSWLWTNKRALTLLQTEKWGQVAILEVGATGVSGIHQTYKAGRRVEKGEEKGYFSFGGSTVMTLFLPGKITLCDDLVACSEKQMELYAKQGDDMGQHYLSLGSI